VSASQKEDQTGIIQLHGQIPLVLTCLLTCLKSAHACVGVIAEDFVDVPSYRGHLFTDTKLYTLIDVLSEGIYKIVLTFYTNLSTFSIPGEVAPLLQQFVDLNH